MSECLKTSNAIMSVVIEIMNSRIEPVLMFANLKFLLKGLRRGIVALSESSMTCSRQPKDV